MDNKGRDEVKQYDHKAERAALDTVLIDQGSTGVLAKFQQILPAADFHNSQNRHIYITMLRIHDAGGVVEAGMLGMYLQGHAVSKDKTGWWVVINHLMDEHASVANAMLYAKTISDWASRRRLTIMCQRLLIESTSGELAGVPVEVLREQAIREMHEAIPLSKATKEGAVLEKTFEWENLQAMEVDDIPDVVEGFIPGESVTMFSGDGGIGKSYTLLEMAMCVSLGLPWLGMETTQMPVLIIDLENRLHRAITRIKAIARAWELKEIPQVSILFESEVSLHTEGNLSELYTLIEARGYGLIILDSLVDFLGGLDENSNTDMADVCKRLRGITESTSSSILPIHHVSKGSAGTNWQSARGASALKDNSDCSIQVVRSERGMGDILTMRHDKARDFSYMCIKARLNWHDGMFNTSLVDTGEAKHSVSGDTGEQALLDAMTKTDWRKRSEVIREAVLQVGSSSTTMFRKMTKLIEDDIVLEDKTSGVWGSSTGVKLA